MKICKPQKQFLRFSHAVISGLVKQQKVVSRSLELPPQDSSFQTGHQVRGHQWKPQGQTVMKVFFIWQTQKQ